ncbi:MAG: GntR family transcriptional regulator [Oscillospiraceae bacterium]|nr:GntR family transcriptional regulator [Oscillospiraceae bacterium]
MTTLTESDKPIYVQTAEWIEDNILSEAFGEETRIPSTTEISVQYKINPATALKGVQMLVDKNIIYKKRGLGMFVAKGAKEKIRETRKQEFFDKYITALISEAQMLGISREEIRQMIDKCFKDGEEK